MANLLDERLVFATQFMGAIGRFMDAHVGHEEPQHLLHDVHLLGLEKDFAVGTDLCDTVLTEAILVDLDRHLSPDLVGQVQ